MSQLPVNNPNSGPNTGLLIAGIVVGLFVGGTMLTLLLFVVFGATADRLGKNGLGLALVFEYLVALVIGVGALVAVRRSVGFVSGFLVGLAAGLLGGTAFCTALAGGLNNMH